MVTGPEPEQVEEGRVLHLRHCGEPTEFPGVLHEGEVLPDEGEEAGGELHSVLSFLSVESSVTIHSGEQGNAETRNFLEIT